MSRQGDANRSGAGSSSSSDSTHMDDLECLNFPGDVDWSTTLVLRCDPNGCIYNMSDVVNALHECVRRNEVFNLGPTVLNHAYTISFRSSYSTENFIKFMKSPKMSKGIRVKGHPCSILKVPSKCVTVHIRNIPLEVDSAHVVQVLNKYGTIVKTELVKSKFQGWFHVYTNERKITLYLKNDVHAQDLPYGIEVKGLFGSVYVAERNPKCLECYYSGHKSDSCEHSDCILYKRQN